MQQQQTTSFHIVNEANLKINVRSVPCFSYSTPWTMSEIGYSCCTFTNFTMAKPKQGKVPNKYGWKNAITKNVTLILGENVTIHSNVQLNSIDLQYITYKKCTLIFPHRKNLIGAKHITKRNLCHLFSSSHHVNPRTETGTLAASATLSMVAGALIAHQLFSPHCCLAAATACLTANNAL